MIKLKIIAIGNKLPNWLNEGVATYQKRFPKDCSLEICEIAPLKRGKNADLNAICEKEGKMLLKHAENSRIVTLDLAGINFTTADLKNRLEFWQIQGVNVSFLIGGPEGLSKECKAKANESWSLSALTLPHGLARLVVAESLYRAWSLSVNHPYHRE